MMKKLLIATVIVNAFAAAAFADTVQPITVPGGKITFNGEVTNGACSISADDANKIVTLDTVRATVFQSANQLANAKRAFTLSFTDCNTATYKTVAITFSGQPDSTVNTLLANTAGVGAATNVGLQLFGPDGKELNLGTATAPITLANGNTSVVPFSVDYRSITASVGAGKVQSVVNFNLTYN